MRRFGWLIGWLLSVSVAQAAVPPNRLQILARGINLDTAVFDPQQSLASWSTDLASIRHAGLLHVRIFVNLDDSHITRLDAIVAGALQNHLAVILCAYSKHEPVTDAASPDAQAYWITAWRRLAQHYRAISPDAMFFEIANEPSMIGPRWAAFQTAVATAVRELAPLHTLLLTASPLSMVWSLPTLPISQDTDVVYVFHLYQPMVFTHQGAGWADPAFQEDRGLQYPPNSANIQAILARPLVMANPAAVQDLLQYERIGATMMGQEIAIAAQWKRQHDVPMVVTEFGVDEAAPEASRAAWLSAARQQFEAAGMGWTVFHYEGSFGLKADLHRCDLVVRALDVCR